MAKLELTFLDFFDETKLKVKETEGFINVNIFNNTTDMWINMDKSTAIKFSKALRTEINKIQS